MTKLSDISKNDVGKIITISCCIDRVFQTKGPTLFELNDGSGSFKAKAFAGAGNRAFPELEQGACASITLEIIEYAGALEGSIKEAALLSEEDAEILKQKLEKQIKTIDKQFSFLCSHPVLENLRSSYISAAGLIHEAIAKNKPIYLRYHHDTDGYCAGYALEKALSTHNSRLLKKHALNTPYYDTADAFRDLSFAIQDKERFNHPMPLFIFADLGSGEESLQALQLLKTYGCTIIVIDHHPVDSHCDSVIDCHINPRQQEPHNIDFSAGMLCTELGFLMNKEISINQWMFTAAISGVADKIKGIALDYYLKDHSIEFIKKVSICIDFIGSQMRFADAMFLINDILSNKEKQETLITILYQPIKEQIKLIKKRAEKYADIKEINNKKIILIPFEKVWQRGTYPRMGKVAGIVHECFENHHLTICHTDTFITIRTTGDYPSLQDFMKTIENKFPLAGVSGGGHECAGSFTFLPQHKEEIMELILQEIAGK